MAVLPIVTYDDPVLRKKAEPVEHNSPELQNLVTDLFETMYEASGVGLAAPQVGISLRLFVVDADAITEDADEESFGPNVFINPEIEVLDGDPWDAEEGCLSLPELREKVKRPLNIRIRYLDSDFKPQEQDCSGWYARVLQHEYDHLNGVLFIDHLGALRKRLIRGKLNQIRIGQVQAAYPLVPKIPEQAHHQQTPKHSDQPSQSNKPNPPDKPGHSEQSDRPEPPGHRDQPLHPSHSEHPDRRT